jgi:hypothetical protein
VALIVVFVLQGTILTQLRTIFDLIIQFQSIQDSMYQIANDEIKARASFEQKTSTKTDKVCGFVQNTHYSFLY